MHSVLFINLFVFFFAFKQQQQQNGISNCLFAFCFICKLISVAHFVFVRLFFITEFAISRSDEILFPRQWTKSGNQMYTRRIRCNRFGCHRSVVAHGKMCLRISMYLRLAIWARFTCTLLTRKHIKLIYDLMILIMIFLSIIFRWLNTLCTK